MWTVDATTDHSQLDAYRRAARWCTPKYAQQLALQAATGSIPEKWRAHRAYGKVELQPTRPEGDVEPDTPTTARRQWTITLTPTGRDGWKGAAVHASAFVVLTRPHPQTGWLVSFVSTA
ncbi:hypothetical protein [Actinomadura fulvescens]